MSDYQDSSAAKTPRFGSQQIIPIATLAIAVIWLVLGYSQFGFWNEKTGSTSAFFPIAVAWVLLVFSFLTFLESLSLQRREQPKYLKESFLLLLCGYGVWFGTFLIGFLPCLLLFLVLWLRFFEKTSWKNILILASILSAIVVGVFVMWLQVPFPDGIIVDTIMNQ
ncbi:hypothetical protein FACS1894204_10070 [Synergistales bacterium]|nr:hypothetical protein FACS1894204_10070 [Synergistales bacterium]